MVEAWRQEYNCFRPHSSLGDLTPEEAIERLNISPVSCFYAGPNIGRTSLNIAARITFKSSFMGLSRFFPS